MSTPPADISRPRPFLRGLRATTPIVLVAAIALAALLLAALQWFVGSGAFTAIPESAMLRIPNDDYVHSSYLLADLAKHPPQGPVVYIFGGSGAIEMMRDEADLGRRVSRAAGEPVRVVRLATHNQSPAQTLAMIDSLPPGRGLVAIGVSTNRFTTTPGEDASLLGDGTLVVRDGALRRFLAPYTDVGRRLPGGLAGVLGFAVSYVRQRASLATPWLTPLTYRQHYIDSSYRPPMAKRVAGARQELDREQPLYDRWALYDFAALAAAVKLAQQKGYRVALFEQPLAPEASGPGWNAFRARYQSDVAAHAAALDVPYIASVQTDAGLRASDFGDLFHLNPKGRAKWAWPFAEALVRALQGRVSLPSSG